MSLIDEDFLEMDEQMEKSKDHTTSLFQSEYGDVQFWCEKFKESLVGVGEEGESAIVERDKIFGILVKMGEKRDELPTLLEYFTVICPECEGKGCEVCDGEGNIRRRIGKYRKTITELNALEYVSALQQKISELKDTKIKPSGVE